MVEILQKFVAFSEYMNFRFIIFWEHRFLARMRCLKNGWPLLAPPIAYFHHPQFLKKEFGESWHQIAFTKKNVEVLVKIEENTSLCTVADLIRERWLDWFFITRLNLLKLRFMNLFICNKHVIKLRMKIWPSQVYLS